MREGPGDGIDGRVSLLMVFDGEDFGADNAEGFDGEGRDGREEADGTEEEPDYVFLREPAEFPAVVEGGAEREFWEELFSRAAADVALYRNDEVLGAFEDEIDRL